MSCNDISSAEIHLLSGEVCFVEEFQQLKYEQKHRKWVKRNGSLDYLGKLKVFVCKSS